MVCALIKKTTHERFT